MQVVPVPTHLDHRSIDQLAAGLGQWPPDQRLLIDAHAAEWASPAGFVALLTLGQAIAETGAPQPALTIPVTSNVASYWAKVGFLEAASELYELHGKVPRRAAAGPSDVLLPVTAMRDTGDVHRVVDRVTEHATHLLRKELHLEAPVVGGFGVSLSELCQNVVEHAGTGGWVAVHIYNFRRRLGRRAAVIAVSDAGIGFRRSLEATQSKRYGERWSDGSALETALIHNISRFRDPGRGQGLLTTKRYLSRWNGAIAIRSGTARVAIVPDWDDSEPMTENLPWFPGSQVTLVIPGKETAE